MPVAHAMSTELLTTSQVWGSAVSATKEWRTALAFFIQQQVVLSDLITTVTGSRSDPLRNSRARREVMFWWNQCQCRATALYIKTAVSESCSVYITCVCTSWVKQYSSEEHSECRSGNTGVTYWQ